MTRDLTARYVFTIFTAVALASSPTRSPLHAAQAAPQPQTAGRLSFDVVSLKERDPRVSLVGVDMQLSPGRLIAHCATLKSLLFYAYRLNWSSPVAGLPAWAGTACSTADTANTYELQATMPVDTTDAQLREMMQTLLADRFKLAAHWESRNLPVYALVVSASGFKLRPSDPKDDPPLGPDLLTCPVDDRACSSFLRGSISLSEFAGSLGSSAGRPVIDKTGLAGTYYLNMKWAGDTLNSSLPSLPTVLRDRFGLELRPETGPVQVLVIDHAEKPSPN